ncbi:cytochrome c [Sphingomonas sp. SUN039]|uniref:cytochrome c n=1 Tax=Sphingomonas sp. SUN039 TaxID=2937787 RepID=UPI0021643110|nr:cytochrome c [Sphingomonas sp. SUN039]UVO52653.1 cytochrome c [Sphingomonas sp. SUN039]
MQWTRGIYRNVGAAAVATLALTAAPIVAAGADPYKARIDSYRELGAAFKNVNDELRKPAPQVFIVQLSARQIRSTAQAQYGFFPAGSGPRPGVKTAARPEIWTQPAQFKAAQDNFARQAQVFAAAAQSGDAAAIRVQAKALGQTCAACHKAFRVEKT